MKQNDGTFNALYRAIEALELYADYADYTEKKSIIHAESMLRNQFALASSAAWTRQELKDYISENDASVIVSEAFKADVREIQHAIIDFFSAD